MKTSRLLELDIARYLSVSPIVQENITQAQCQQMILYNNLEINNVCPNSKSGSE